MQVTRFTKAAFLILILVSTVMSCRTQTISDVSLDNAPVLSIKNDSVDIKISTLRVQVKVMGNIALTSYDMLIYNPSERILEGELSFPLKANQQIVEFSMDVNGKLRKGVVVEKDKARQVFESIVRRGIDPGLVEKTSGNNFRARIFPIPAQGTKHVVITCQEELNLNDKNYSYLLPLNFNKPTEHFSMRIEVIKGYKRPRIIHNDFSELDFSIWNDSYVAEINREKTMVSGLLNIKLPYSGKQNTLLTKKIDNTTFFYTILPLNDNSTECKQVNHIHLLWDTSGSSTKRDFEKEKQLLKAYCSYLDYTKVSLSTFNHKLKSIGEFSIKDGSCEELFNAINNLIYDGGSSMDQIDLSSLKGEEIILVSDGLANMGDMKINQCGKIVTTINSSIKANHTFLKHLAMHNGGHYIDLTTLNVDDALSKITIQPLSIQVKPMGQTIHQRNINWNVKGDQLIISGKTNANHGTLKVIYSLHGNTLREQLLNIEPEEDYLKLPLPRIWATHQIDALMMNKRKNKPQIITLAKQYGVVTDYTSLLVLEELSDYLRYDIIPPEELQEAYFKIKQRNKMRRQDLHTQSFAVLNQQVKGYKDWWYNRLDPEQLHVQDEERDDIPAIREEIAPITRQGNVSPPPPPPPPSYTLDVLTMVDDDSEISEELEIADCDDTPPRKSNIGRLQIGINIQAWDSTAGYIKDIKELSNSEIYPYYLSVKHQYEKQPSFFLDVASYLFSKKRNSEAVAVIANIVELQLENAEILRIAAHKLLQEGWNNQALKLFKKILEIRSEDLQSYRDLAIAYEKTGAYKDAISTYIKALNMRELRGNRSIYSIMINEINNLRLRHSDIVIPDEFRKEWIYDMPVDLRIVLSWSSDNTDVDLWILEPSGEKCFYKNTLTKSGGIMSQDITTGYGPEEYCIRKAKKGVYHIQANYYANHRMSVSGPVTLRAEIFRNYGTPNQTNRQIVLQLKKKKQVIDLGEVIVE
ncbi:DUF2135 domain-containing protein [Puteibacter caeruleilacunae]|nr:DUF2135 domain-containing protein [Puteibacter caeruleilacunae]